MCVARHARHEEPGALPGGTTSTVELRGRRGGGRLATSDAAARDALDHIVVEYEPVRRSSTSKTRLSDRVIVHPELGTNLSVTLGASSARQPRHRVRRCRAHGQRTLRPATPDAHGNGAARSGRGSAAIRRRHHVVLGDADSPHPEGHGCHHLGIPEHHVRVVAPSVGGGFG